MRNKYLEWFCKIVVISLESDIVEKYLTMGKSKLHISFYTSSEDGLDVYRFFNRK